MNDLSAEQLLACAREVMHQPDAGWRSLWPLAAANLTRQALEAGVDRVWTGPRAGMVDACQKAQMVCLPTFLGDRRLAGDVYTAWCALSNACHAHPYDLAPTAAELRDWTAVVERLLTTTSRVIPAGKGDFAEVTP
jgi:hypothetical protein